LTRALGRFGFAPELLLLQPGQLPFERSDLWHTPSDQNQQLRDDPLADARSLFPLLFALDGPGVLLTIIMSGLSITESPQRRQ
jgi:hypothetical protein